MSEIKSETIGISHKLSSTINVNDNDSKKDLQVLKNDTEVQEKDSNFETLEKDFEKNEAMKELLDMVGGYIEFKLGEGFSPIEKSNIKLSFLKKLNISSIIGGIITNLIEPLKNLFGDSSIEGEEVSLENTKEIFEKYSKKFKDTGLLSVQSFIDNEIDIIIKEKKDSKTDFTKLSSTLNGMGIGTEGKSEKEIFDEIKTEANDIAKKLKTGREFGDDITDALSSLPFGIGDSIASWIKNTIKGGGFLGMILKLFFGNNIESNVKGGESVNNLKEFAKTDKFKLKDNIKAEELKNLDSDKLKDFFGFLHGEKIDYTSDTFWNDLLNGNPKNPKINELHELLKNKNGKILDKGEKLDDLIDKLNGLGAKKKEIKNKEKVNSIKSKIAKLEGKDISTENKKSTEKITLTPEQEKELQDLKFKESVLSFKDLPVEILYMGETLILDIDGKDIILGDKSYSISIMAETYGERFKKIEFKNGNFYLNGDNEIKREQVFTLIKSLKTNGNFSLNGTKKGAGFFGGDVKYELKIN